MLPVQPVSIIKKINLEKSLKNSEGFVKASVFQGFLRLHPL